MKQRLAWLRLLMVFVIVGMLATVVPQPQPAYTQIPGLNCPAGQMAAQYWTGIALSGTAATTTCEAFGTADSIMTISHQWDGVAAPANTTGVPATNWSARWTWTGTLVSGGYLFHVSSDDGSRIYVDGTLVLDNWATQSTTTKEARFRVSGNTHTVVVEYYNGTGPGVLSYSSDWQSQGGNYPLVATPTPIPGPTSTPVPPSLPITYLSDMTPTGTPTNGYGPYERDMANGGPSAGDGPALTLAGVTYAKGLGMNSAADITYAINNCSTFSALVGVDDEVGTLGTVVFQVYTGATKIFDSGTMNGASATQTVSVSVAGATTLRLVITDAGDGNGWDHGDWADAKVACQVASTTTTYLSDVNPHSAINGYGTYERDRSNGSNRPADGLTLTLAGVTYSKGLGTHSPGELAYAVKGNCSRLRAVVGIDDEVTGTNGSAWPEVWADGYMLWRSTGVMTSASASQTIDISIAGRQEIRLQARSSIVSGVVQPNTNNHIDWADARIDCVSTWTPPAFVAQTEQSAGALQTLVNNAAVNSVVTVPAGIYRETVSITKQLTLRGAPGAEIRGSNIVTGGFTGSGPYTSTSTFAVIGTDGSQPSWICDVANPRCRQYGAVYMDGWELDQRDYACTPTTGQWCYAASSGTASIKLGDNPSGRVVEIAARNQWLNINSSAGVNIEDLTFRYASNGPSAPAIYSDGSQNVSVRRNVMYDVSGAMAGPGEPGHNYTLEDNVMLRAGHKAVYSYNANNYIVQRNRIGWANHRAFFAGWDAGAMKLWAAQDSYVRDNEAYFSEFGAHGIWCDTDCIRMYYQRNRSHHNGGHGVFHEISYQAEMSGNVAWENGFDFDTAGANGGVGITHTSGQDVTMFGNVAAWNAKGISVWSSYDNYHPMRNTVHDNVSIQQRTNDFILTWECGPRGPGGGNTCPEMVNPSSTNQTYNNQVWHPGGDCTGSQQYGFNANFSHTNCIANFNTEASVTYSNPGNTFMSDAAKDAALAAAGIPLTSER